MDERIWRSKEFVILARWTQHDRNCVTAQAIAPKLLGDVVLATGILQSQIKLVPEQQNNLA